MRNHSALDSRQSAPRKKGGSLKEHAALREQEMLDGVRGAGLKLTPQRIAIVHAIAGDPTHPTAQEIFDRLQASMPTMSFATVYNTLDALARAGVCGSLSLAPGPARFDPNMEPHHHAVCDGCGLVRDVERHGSEGRQRSIDDALSGFEVRAVEHIYRGFCSACARKGGSRKGAVASAANRPAPKGAVASAASRPAMKGSVASAASRPAMKGSVASAASRPAHKGAVASAAHRAAHKASVSRP